jgi:hypothetical protein
MSADNFMAILVTPTADGKGSEWRVGELRASEAWHRTGFDGLYESKKFEELKSWAYEVWFESEVYSTEEEAFSYAHDYENNNIVEYGSSAYEFPFQFSSEWQQAK